MSLLPGSAPVSCGWAVLGGLELEGHGVAHRAPPRAGAARAAHRPRESLVVLEHHVGLSACSGSPPTRATIAGVPRAAPGPASPRTTPAGTAAPPRPRPRSTRRAPRRPRTPRAGSPRASRARPPGAGKRTRRWLGDAVAHRADDIQARPAEPGERRTARSNPFRVQEPGQTNTLGRVEAEPAPGGLARRPACDPDPLLVGDERPADRDRYSRSSARRSARVWNSTRGAARNAPAEEDVVGPPRTGGSASWTRTSTWAARAQSARTRSAVAIFDSAARGAEVEARLKMDDHAVEAGGHAGRPRNAAPPRNPRALSVPVGGRQDATSWPASRSRPPGPRHRRRCRRGRGGKGATTGPSQGLDLDLDGDEHRRRCSPRPGRRRRRIGSRASGRRC